MATRKVTFLIDNLNMYDCAQCSCQNLIDCGVLSGMKHGLCRDIKGPFSGDGCIGIIPLYGRYAQDKAMREITELATKCKYNQGR